MKILSKIASKVVYWALLIYYVMRSPSVTKVDKAKVYGALAYFIWPFDFVTDLIPVAGYADDMSAIAWAVYTIWKNITPEIKTLAASRTNEIIRF